MRADNVKKVVEGPRRTCPICGKPAVPDVTPFCSRRCSDIDLNRWLGGVYAIPAKTENDDETVIEDSDP